MNKRGQFFIVAAMILVSVIAGLTTVVNYAEATRGEERIYDLSNEIKSETNMVVDWGVFKEAELDVLTTTFLEKYDSYIGEEDVLFIFGNEDDLEALHFTSEGIGSVGIETREGGTSIVEVNRRTGKEANVTVDEGRRIGEKKILIEIDDAGYSFNLKDGENFYFVIVKESGDERFVVSR